MRDANNSSETDCQIIHLPGQKNAKVNKLFLSLQGVKQLFERKFSHCIFVPCILLDHNDDIGWLIKDIYSHSSSNAGFISFRQNKLLLKDKDIKLDPAIYTPFKDGSVVYSHEDYFLIFDGEKFVCNS